MISVAELVVTRAGHDICRVTDLEIGRGERVAVIGDNGSGKTTLLRIIVGLENDFTGRCEVAACRRARGFLQQQPLLFRGTVMDNVTYGLRCRGHERAAAERAAAVWLERFSITALADRGVEHLSGGEIRRVALARAIVVAPTLLVLDEPLAEMDEGGVAQVARAFAELAETTIVIASPVELPDGLVDRTVELLRS